MKLQSLAVIFIIIILPISIILSAYTQNQITTINLQASYDSKLDNATYDAIKAFQLNTFNSDTSDIIDSKIRDIEASVNTFYNSIATNFNMAGYNSDVLKAYVPALVYTLYDGYYIYAPYQNIADSNNSNNMTYGLKPYIYYSCRYKNYPQSGDDFVITYSLDNYITIQGKVNGQEGVNDSGYLLSNVEVNDLVKYRGIIIDEETVGTENVEYIENNLFVDNSSEYPCKKNNGAKYYEDNSGRTFTVINGTRYDYTGTDISLDKDTNAKNYYTAAYYLGKRLKEKYNLENLSTTHAYVIDSKGNETQMSNIYGNYKIFEGLLESNVDVAIEEPNSNFNQHRLAVIRNSIETNLSTAIANYNNYTSSTTANFQMPKLKEDEWDKLTSNIAMISFLQGLNIGGKVYNGYSIINNNNNSEVVTEDSIYIADTDTYYSVASSKFENGINVNDYRGIFNMDLKRTSVIDKSGQYHYFYPKKQMADYESVISRASIGEQENIYDYLDVDGRENLAKLYYTALGRERYGMYRVNGYKNRIEEK